MNTSKRIENSRKVGGDYFRLQVRRISNLYLKDFIDKFNFDDYWCFKSSTHQRLVNEKDFLEFKYACYIFFRKDLYDVSKILEWVEWCKNIGGIQYLVKPTPPFSPKKVMIKQ